MPLRTADPRRARFLATQIDALADLHLFPTFMTLQLTRAQMQEIFRKVFLAHLDKVDAIAAREKAERGFKVAEARSSDQVMGWVYRLAEIRGAGIEQIDSDALALMRSAGLTDDQIHEVGAVFDHLRRRDLLAERPERLAAIVQEVGAEPTVLNQSLAQETIFRARAEAFLQTGRRYDGVRVETKDIVARILQEPSQTPETLTSTHAQAVPANVEALQTAVAAARQTGVDISPSQPKNIPEVLRGTSGCCLW